MGFSTGCMALVFLTASPTLAASAEAYIAQSGQARALIESSKAMVASAISTATLAVPVKLESRTADTRSVSPTANMSYVAQTGTNNSAIVAQTGGANFSSVVQNGTGNQAVVSQRTATR